MLVPFTSLLTHIINSLLAEKRVAKFRSFLRPWGLVGSVAGPGSEPAQLALWHSAKCVSSGRFPNISAPHCPCLENGATDSIYHTEQWSSWSSLPRAGWTNSACRPNPAEDTSWEYFCMFFKNVWLSVAHKAKYIYSLALHKNVCQPVLWGVEPCLAQGDTFAQGILLFSPLTNLCPGFLLAWAFDANALHHQD